MNNITRRNFLGKCGMVGGIISILSPSILSASPPAIIKQSSELDDLYNFLESKTIITPIKGEIPFKLYPFQKQILKQIHENDRVIFVKARQIGMSLLTAGYCAWIEHKKGSDANIYGACPNWELMKHWNNLLSCFDGTNINMKYNGFRCACGWPTPDKYNVVVLDELNYNDEFLEFSIQLTEGMDKGLDNNNVPSPGKIIIAGTPDGSRLYKAVYETPELKHFKTFYYPATECSPLWNADKIEFFLTGGRFSERYYREVYAKL